MYKCGSESSEELAGKGAKGRGLQVFKNPRGHDQQVDMGVPRP